MSDSVLVYSTDVGRIKEEKLTVARPKGDGVVRIQNKRVVEKVLAYQL